MSWCFCKTGRARRESIGDSGIVDDPSLFDKWLCITQIIENNLNQLFPQNAHNFRKYSVFDCISSWLVSRRSLIQLKNIEDKIRSVVSQLHYFSWQAARSAHWTLFSHLYRLDDTGPAEHMSTFCCTSLFHLVIANSTKHPLSHLPSLLRLSSQFGLF